MTNEVKTRKNNDYTASAVNLNNNEIFQAELEKYHEAIKDLDAVKTTLESTPEWTAYQHAQENVEIIKKGIQGAIILHGSFQDLETGSYALLQKRITKLYNAANFEACYPDLAPAVMEKVINVKALEALIKAGRVSEDALKRGGVMTEGESLAFIIK